MLQPFHPRSTMSSNVRREHQKTLKRAQKNKERKMKKRRHFTFDIVSSLGW